MGKLIVTIARQYGSGGKTIGQMLAENLGVNCYNREILRMASDDSGIKEELFNQADEKLRNNPLLGNSTRIYKGGLIQPDHGGFVSADNLFNYQAKVIKELAEKESCVFIGRCADFVLKDRPDVMSVFIHAPQDYCLARGMERNSMTEKVAGVRPVRSYSVAVTSSVFTFSPFTYTLYPVVATLSKAASHAT